MAADEVVSVDGAKLPGFAAAISAPLVAILLLALRPIAGIVVDLLIALPLGGLVGALMMGKFTKVNQFAVSAWPAWHRWPSCCWGRVPWRASSPTPA